jgi:pyridoxine 5-phosphate synthase
LFIAPEFRQIEAAARMGAPAIEIHVGPWCEAVAQGWVGEVEAEWRRIVDAARAAHGLGLEVHAGHGLDYATAATISGLPEIVELNIGHFLVGEALFVGLAESVSRMRMSIDQARAMLRHSDTESEVSGT